MTKKPRENRVPIMMSEDELASIDDWRFANRIATRSDPIRRLCQIGMIFDYFIRTYGPDHLELVEAVDVKAGESFTLSPDEVRMFKRFSGALFAFGGKAVRYGGHEKLEELLTNDAYLKWLANNEDHDE